MLKGPAILVRLPMLISKHIQIHNIVLVYLLRIKGPVLKKIKQSTSEKVFRRTPAEMVLKYANSPTALFLTSHLY